MSDFLRGDPEKWTGRFGLAFRRPDSTFTHVVDYTLWPNSGPMMDVQSLLWLVALIGVVGLFPLFLESGRGVSGSVLYVPDDGHELPAGWLANRNTLVTETYGFSSLLIRDRWRRGNCRAGLRPSCSPTPYSWRLVKGGGAGIRSSLALQMMEETVKGPAFTLPDDDELTRQQW